MLPHTSRLSSIAWVLSEVGRADEQWHWCTSLAASVARAAVQHLLLDLQLLPELLLPVNICANSSCRAADTAFKGILKPTSGCSMDFAVDGQQLAVDFDVTAFF